MELYCGDYSLEQFLWDCSGYNCAKCVIQEVCELTSILNGTKEHKHDS